MNISRNIHRTVYVFIIFFVVLSVVLVYWQVIVADQVTSNIHNERNCLANNAPVRGRIFDRNGVLLADTQRVSYGCGYVRHYYDPSLAGLIGYYAGSNYPATGLESAFNDYLTGQRGMTGLDNIINKTLHRPPVGDDIYLTIDERVQHIAEASFDAPVTIDNQNTFATNRGSVIVTDPHTGEILAMISRPEYDPNQLVQTLAQGDLSYYQQLAQNPDKPLLMRPLDALYTPGSIYKTVTLLAALDSGHTTLNQDFSKQQALGPVTFPGSGHPVGPAGNNIAPYTSRFPVTTEYGYVHSDNVMFAQIGYNTGAATWLAYNQRFFVGKTIPFDLPVVPSSVSSNGQPLDVDTLAANAFGQGVDFVTPMQMSLIDNIVANDGQLMKPMIISKIVDKDGVTIQQNTPQSLGQVVDAQTARDVRQAMYGVVRCGSGSLAEVQLVNSPWDIIGKTGTAELGGAQHAHAWFISAAPYSVTNPDQLPRLTIVAMKENGGEGGQADGPILAQMYNNIFTQVLNTPTPPAPNPTYCATTGLLQ
ncbi:MAG TPA: penicillin-binding protein 2 [Ktedonobacteraceae bacterium]